ncbi:hypothetical protein [Streptomyces sp. NRRL S-350]|uniref:hypothetical protein n=1 Tax=Streptomyces sp. NRRL S-350 TaxID=1463902 RepID=UPI0004C2509B|nr:hypothetical protein [Streptomyces sp. NRRL S-350]
MTHPTDEEETPLHFRPDALRLTVLQPDAPPAFTFHAPPREPFSTPGSDPWTIRGRSVPPDAAHLSGSYDQLGRPLAGQRMTALRIPLPTADGTRLLAACVTDTAPGIPPAVRLIAAEMWLPSTTRGAWTHLLFPGLTHEVELVPNPDRLLLHCRTIATNTWGTGPHGDGPPVGPHALMVVAQTSTPPPPPGWNPLK